jgi:signal peptidase I
VVEPPAPSEDGTARHRPRSQEEGGGFWRSLLLTVAVALGIRQFLVEARYIPSGSMLPGLQLQDRLLVEKLSYRQRPPRRGEIIVFHAPHAFDPALRSDYQAAPGRCFLVNLPFIGSLPGMQEPACDAFIKRVIAVAGDRVTVDPGGHVILNGRPLEEPYVRNWCRPVGPGSCRSLDTTVPAGSVLVLGDNRGNSWDGRFWPGTHFVPTGQIIGRAFFRFFPFSSVGGLVMADPAASSGAAVVPPPAGRP